MKQQVALNCQASPWTSIEADVPKGSIIRPLALLFLIYINDLSDNLSTTLSSLQMIHPFFL